MPKRHHGYPDSNPAAFLAAVVVAILFMLYKTWSRS